MTSRDERVSFQWSHHDTDSSGYGFWQSLRNFYCLLINFLVFIESGKRSVIGGCSNTNRHGASVHKFLKDETLREKWDRFVWHSTPGTRAQERLAGMLCSVFPKSPSITKTLLSGKWDSPGNWIWKRAQSCLLESLNRHSQNRKGPVKVPSCYVWPNPPCFLLLQQQLADPSRPTYTCCT